LDKGTVLNTKLIKRNAYGLGLVTVNLHSKTLLRISSWRKSLRF